MNGLLKFLICVSVLGLLGACTKKKPSEETNSPEQQLARGKVIYQVSCTACHNSDPHKPGSLGPEVFGSSKELLEARLLRGEYPPNYKRKRDTHVMQALPHLKDEIPALFEYLNQPK